MIGMINHNQVNKVNCSQLEKYQKVLLTKKTNKKTYYFIRAAIVHEV